ncbi:hypothetical protein KR084_009595 [Drosophila pseudotakahashii]|nr:hypothetical protein KR084_009595 [Drosophila pseudotakahashii]
MARLNWITLLQLIMIFGAFPFGDLKITPDWFSQRFFKAFSSAGSIVKVGSMSLENLGAAISNMNNIPNGMAQSINDLFGAAQTEKDAHASDPSCSKGGIMCQIKS